MAVTRQEYSIEPTWTATQVADNLIGPALIAAGLMTNWHDTFSISTVHYRVMEHVFDPTKTYGKIYYLFIFTGGTCGVSAYTGWDSTNNVPTGSQFLDWHLVPTNTNSTFSNRQCYELANYTTTTRLTLVRYSSQDNSNQNWFVFRQGTTNGVPFTFMHPNSQRYSFLNLDQGCIIGLSTCRQSVSNRIGYIDFRLQENLRRQLCIGQALNGDTDTSFANGKYHAAEYITHRYSGTGRFTNNTGSNISTDIGSIPLPVGHSTSNPAYASNYSPICTDLPWNLWTAEPLATDLGIYMHYADNNITFNDRFVVTPGVEEWEVIAFANNTTVDFGASPCFVARVI